MKQLRFVLALLTAFTSIAASAQVEGQDVSPTRSEMQPLHFDQPILADTLCISSIVPYSELQKSELPLLQSSYDHTSNYMLPIMPALKPYQLWDGTSVIVYGSNNQMLGLMDVATGSVSLHQDFGRLHFVASAVANKYWMPMQSQLYTQYGIGGTIGYDITNAVSLHAFGYYYAQNSLVAPAFSPYVSTTSFGGFAYIRFSENFGIEVGVRRYVNPMSGRWTTSPIVTPYFHVGKRHKVEIGLPLGELLKAAIWGDNDNPLRYRPQPQPQPKKK
jgi:hypothetical protein